MRHGTLVACCALVSAISAQNAFASEPQPKPISVTICQLEANPKAYKGKLITGVGEYFVGPHAGHLGDPHCEDKPASIGIAPTDDRKLDRQSRRAWHKMMDKSGTWVHFVGVFKFESGASVEDDSAIEITKLRLIPR